MKAQRRPYEATFARRRARNHDRELPAAAWGRRFAARAFDLAHLAVLTLGASCFDAYAPGALLPLWVFCAGVVGCIIVPLWLTGRTLGLRAFGLKLIRVDGQRMGLADLAFRELVVQGLVGASVLLAAAAAPVLKSNGIDGVPAPSGTLFLTLAWMSTAFAATSSVFGWVQHDGRSLADVFAKVMLVDVEAHEGSTLRLVGTNARRPECAYFAKAQVSEPKS